MTQIDWRARADQAEFLLSVLAACAERSIKACCAMEALAVDNAHDADVAEAITRSQAKEIEGLKADRARRAAS